MPVLTRYPSSVVSAGTWVNGANAYADDTNYATNPNSSRNSDQAIDLGGFDFSGLPDDAVLNSVTVRAMSWNTSGTVTTKIQPWDGATGIGTQQTHTNPAADGNPWDTTWSPTVAQLKSANFFLRFVTRRTSTTAGTTNLDFLYVSVDFSYAPQNVTTPALDETEEFYPPTVTVGPVGVTGATVPTEVALYAPTVDAVAPTSWLDFSRRRPTRRRAHNVIRRR